MAASVPSYAQLEAGRELDAEESEPRPRRSRLVLGASALAGFAALAFVALRRPASAPQRADVAAAEGKMGLLAMADAMANGLTASAKVIEDAKQVYPDMQEALKAVEAPSEGLKEAIGKLNGTSKLVNVSQLESLSVHELLHPKAENRHDGNPCPDDEELHMGLCYKKCALLTEGIYTIRTTAWSCCHDEPCSFFNSKFVHSLLPCEGFDVSGSKEGEGCPHFPGSCMENEEFSLGICYKKCALLTNNTFPYRSGADTCCRYNNHFACMDALNVNSSMAFNVGGGLGDKTEATPGKAHGPIPALTEA